jgi:hypothetical protein
MLRLRWILRKQVVRMNVDDIDSESCAIMSSGIRSVEPLASASRVSYLIVKCWTFKFYDIKFCDQLILKYSWKTVFHAVSFMSTFRVFIHLRHKIIASCKITDLKGMQPLI